MFSSKDMPSASSLFSTYASISTSIMLFRSVANDVVNLVPPPLRRYLSSNLGYLFKRRSNKLTLVIEEFGGNNMNRNQIYDASETYLSTKISPEAERLKVNKTAKGKTIAIRFEEGEKIDDVYQGIDLKWRFVCVERSNNKDDFDEPNGRSEKRHFELSFDKKHGEVVLHSYLPFVLEKSKALKSKERVVKLCTLGHSYRCGGSPWDSINLEHPATFDTLAMEPDLKKAIIDDLDRFVRRKEFYKRVGRAWKRGYLLYGPPGTGKSTLVAAMANYLKFDIYDLQLANIRNDADLRRVLLATANRSILVIEDIDCTVEIPDRRRGDGTGNGPTQPDLKFTLSGLLNFIDGLWSSCGDERIIIFTTNHKERLDPALLRPGRMDMHIHMSYCTIHGFKLLASNYLGTNTDVHPELFREIEGYLEATEVTPAQLTEELMKNDDAEIALGEVLKLLKRKSMESDEPVYEAADKAGILQGKRQKIGNQKRNVKKLGRSTRIEKETYD